MAKKPEIVTLDPMSDNGSVKNKLITERYKFILTEIHHLNENVHRFMTIFQTIATAIIGGGIFILASWKNYNLSPETTINLINSLASLLKLITIFFSLSIAATIASWCDYRKEETKLLDQIIGPGFRQPPKLKNLWRWSETYFIIFMIAFSHYVNKYVEIQVIPTIH